MKDIVIPKFVTVDDDLNVISSPGYVLKIEHSLLSISEWESKWKKPFFEQKQYTYDEFVSYVKFMTVNKDEVPDHAYECLTMDNTKEIQAYMNEKPSATIIKRTEKPKQQKRFLTSELIYAWMAQARVPYSAETMNIWRLLNIIEIISIENQPKKKVSKADTLNKYRAMNKARRKPR